MSPLWSAEAFVQATSGGRPTRPAGTIGDITGISIDTRTLQPGDAFFAIAGDRLDGHDYVGEALAKGAVLAVVSDPSRAAAPEDAALVVVPDVLAGLVAVGAAARERSQARITAVTGSVGKTGTKEMLLRAFMASGETHASAASYNNHWGVPLSLARLPAAAAYGVFEIGMNHAGEITPLTKQVRPHIAIITTVEPVHIAFFPSVEDIARAKAEIFLGLEPDGVAVVNADNPLADLLADEARRAGAARIVSFGAAAGADVRLLAFEDSGGFSDVAADVLGTAVRYRLAQPGRHVAHNSLAVLAALHLAGADVAAGAATLAEIAAPRGRGRIVRLELEGGPATLLDEAYNANPASMRAAFAQFAALRPAPGGRRIAVLGDMLELGERSADYHRDLAPDLAATSAAVVHTVGPMMTALREALPPDLRGVHAETAAELVDAVLNDVRAGDVVVVKGSNGIKMAQIVDSLVERHTAPSAGAVG